MKDSQRKAMFAKKKLSSDDLRWLGEVEDKNRYRLQDMLYEDNDGGLHADMRYSKRKMKKYQDLVKNTNLYENSIYKGNPRGQSNARHRRKDYQSAVKHWSKDYVKKKNMFEYVTALWKEK